MVQPTVCDLCGEIDQIPAESRVSAWGGRAECPPPAKPPHRRRKAARDAAVKNTGRAEVAGRAAQGTGGAVERAPSSRAHDLHKKLDELLGQNGLQRELVRDAEEQIVDLANETLKNLSDHGASPSKPDDDATGWDDKAFALDVRRAADPLPTPVAFSLRQPGEVPRRGFRGDRRRAIRQRASQASGGRDYRRRLRQPR